MSSSIQNNAFHNAMDESQPTLTKNGAVSNSKPDIGGQEGRLTLFCKSVRNVNFVFLSKYLEKSAEEDIIDTCCLIMHTRDILNGKGERMVGRYMFQWLLINYPKVMDKIYNLIVEYGRWDDILWLFPNKLKLIDLIWVNGNYCSSINNETLIVAQRVQENIVNYFVQQLDNDWISVMNYENNKSEGITELSGECSEELPKLSLISKWTPTEGTSSDKEFEYVKTICKEWNIHPKGYRKRVVRMRTILNVVEQMCCTNNWGKIDYSRVPSQTMKRLRKAFVKHDSRRFSEWLQSLGKNSNVKINAKTLHPHELVKQYIDPSMCYDLVNSQNIDSVIEAQWKELENIVKKSGSMEKTIVVTDVSGSMYMTNKHNIRPIDVSIALSLLIARTSQAPWNNAVIAFSAEALFHKIDTKSEKLIDMVNSISQIEQGLNTNFNRVFTNIIEKHHQYKLKPSEHPERVIVISDMQFDQADQNMTNHEAIDKMYKENNLTRPTIIYWNVSSELDFPVTTRDKNVCMIGGFSPSILNTLATTREFTPSKIMRDVIESKQYDKIRESITK